MIVWDNHTFVICAYKESVYLEDCIKSLKEQTVLSRIIMVTSTPNDYINNMAEKYNITVYINTGENGIAQDWNFGCSKVQTDYFTIAHQDDVYKPQYLESIKKSIDNVRKPIICFTNYGELRDGEEVDNSTLLKVKRFMLAPLKNKKLQQSIWVRRRILSMGNAICCPSVTFCRKRMPVKIFQEKYRSNMDWLAWEKLSKEKGSFIYCPQILMLHRIHEESTTSELIMDNKRWMEDYEVFRCFWPKWMADIIIKFYRKSEESNQV